MDRYSKKYLTIILDLYLVGWFDPCHIPDAWAHRAQKEEKKEGEKKKGSGLGTVLLNRVCLCNCGL